MPTKIPHRTLKFAYQCSHEKCEFSERYSDVVADHERDLHDRKSPRHPEPQGARCEFRST